MSVAECVFLKTINNKQRNDTRVMAALDCTKCGIQCDCMHHLTTHANQNRRQSFKSPFNNS